MYLNKVDKKAKLFLSKVPATSDLRIRPAASIDIEVFESFSCSVLKSRRHICPNKGIFAVHRVLNFAPL